MFNFSITTDISKLTNLQLATLYGAVGFGVAEAYLAEADFVGRTFPAGVFGFFAYEGDELVGMIRVLSDDRMCTWIAEACVAPRLQRKGVATTLLETMERRFGHTSIYVEAFAESVALFEKIGLRAKSKLIACSRAARREATAASPSDPFIH
jgi:GNAT superfamily N-acetyltransferase